MEDYDYKTIEEVGRISYEALLYSKTVVKSGVRLLDAAEQIEEFIRKKGFELAFPVNLSVDQNAAHYTPSFEDKTVFSPNDLVKVDIGARKGSYLGDNALTIDLSGRNSALVAAAEEALENAIGVVRAGRKVCEIGAEIEKVARAHGFQPIRNLGGHGISREDLHASVFIPNYDNGDQMELKEGEVIAIEPFLTTGEGYVQNGDYIEIFQKTQRVSVRSNETREISRFVDEHYSTYPFALRWVQREMKEKSEFTIRRAIAELSAAEALEQFPVLVERKKGMVAQAEKEMIVEKDSCKVITRQ
jgi:methionyl aminopeptidase